MQVLFPKIPGSLADPCFIVLSEEKGFRKWYGIPQGVEYDCVFVYEMCCQEIYGRIIEIKLNSFDIYSHN